MIRAVAAPAAVSRDSKVVTHPFFAELVSERRNTKIAAKMT